MNEQRIEEFLETIEEIFSGLDPNTFWPLNAGQIDSYFDVAEAIDMYYRINKLRETHSIKEIAAMLPPPDIMRLFLEHNGIIGLKVAKKLKIAPITTEQRVEYLNLIFDIIKEQTLNDIFCRDGKNILVGQEHIEEFLEKSNWQIPTEKQKREIAELTITANHLAYSLYYDIFMAGGFYIHGPYDASKKFGEKTTLLIRNYHNINPKELWPELNIPYKRLRIYAIYKDLDLKITFANHPVSTTGIGNKLMAYKIVLDDKKISGEEIEKLTNLFEKIINSQTKKINALTNLDKVRKGIEIAYYLFKDFREQMGDDWRPPKFIEDEVIKEFGETFIKKFAKPHRDPKIYRKIFDPRIDEYEF